MFKLKKRMKHGNLEKAREPGIEIIEPLLISSCKLYNARAE